MLAARRRLGVFVTEMEWARRKNGGVQTRVREGSWTVARRAGFLDMLGQTANVRRSVLTVGMSESGVYRLRKRDAGFRAAWDAALAEGYALLERLLLARALETMGGAEGGAARLPEDVVAMPYRVMLALLQLHRAQVGALRAAQIDASAERIEDARVREQLIERLEGMTGRIAEAIDAG